MNLRIDRAGFALCGLALLLLGAAAASVLYVNVDRLDIVDKKRAVAKVVTTVDRNAALNVVAQEGNWYKVDVNGQQGYVFHTAVADKPGQAKGKGVNLAGLKSGSNPGLETAAAVKGIGDGARKYASGSGLRTDGLQEMIRRSNSIKPEEFDGFVSEVSR
jgi:hypothetical protein